MKRLSRKGFMMAEVIVVAAVVLGVLTSIYTSYNKVFVRYKQLLSYYNVDGVYKLANIRDALIIASGTESGENGIANFLNKVNSESCNFYPAMPVLNSLIPLFVIKTSALSFSENPCNNGVDNDFWNYMRNNVVDYKNKTNHIIFYKWKENGKEYWNYLELEA